MDASKNAGRVRRPSAVRTLAPILLLFAAFLAVATALLIYTAERQNRLAHGAERHLARSALLGVRNGVLDFAQDYAFWNATVENVVQNYDPEWADENIGQWAIDGLNMDGAAVFGAGNRIIHTASRHGDGRAFAQPYPPAVIAMIERVRADPGTPGTPQKPVHTYFRDAHGVHLAGAAAIIWEDARPPAQDDGTLAVLVYFRTLSEARLAALSADFLLADLRLAPANAATVAGLPLTDVTGATVGQLTWAAARPGWQMLQSLAGPLSGAFLVMAVLLACAVRGAMRAQTALDAYQNRLETNARELARARDTAEQQAAQLSDQAHDLRAARDRAHEASRAKSEFLATMSHELRTPLNSIMGFAEAIRLGYAKGERSREYAAHIQGSGEHLLSLLNDILDLSKIEARRYELEEEWVDLAALVDQAFELVQGRAQERAVRLSHAVDPIPVYADARALKQVLINLVGNAIKFAPQNSAVDVRTERLDAGLRLGVRDEGPGMSAAELAEAGRMFGQGRPQGDQPEPGTGLGLNICRALLDLHGGDLSFQTAPGAGTTAVIWLPETRLRAYSTPVALPA